MSSLTQPVLKTQSELVDQICTKVGKGFSLRQARQALEEAMQSWSQRVCLCFCKELPEPFEYGVCEYDCGCCGVDDFDVYIQRDGCSCGSPNCWHETQCYDVICGKILTDGIIAGRVKLEYRVPNPPIQWRKLDLSATYEEGDETIWLKGRIENLPPAGYLKIYDHWVSYQCYAQVAVGETNLFDAYEAEAFLDSEEVIFSDIERRSGLVYDAAPEIEVGPPCGIHTVLHEVQEVCPSIHRQEFYPIGTEVEFGIAANNTGTISYLLDLAMVAAYEARVTTCSTDIERDTAFTMISYYQEKAERGARQLPKRIKRAKTGRTSWGLHATRGGNYLPRRVAGWDATRARPKVYY